MGYDIELVDEAGELLPVPPHSAGSMLKMDSKMEKVIPEDLSEITITYNYAEPLHTFFEFSFRHLDGNQAKHFLDTLKDIVDKFGTTKYDRDYWAPTLGNIGYVCNILLSWSEMYPDAWWKVT